MALILEVRDGRGMPHWHRLDQLPLTLGRGLSNSIILDDPYVDARHARIAINESGELVIDDVGSVNGLYTNGARSKGTVVLRAGTEVRIGRTLLRIRDEDEIVAPALVDAPRAPRAWQRLDSRWGQIAVIVAMLVVTALNTWLGSTERSSGSTVFAAVVAAAFMTFAWAAIWAIATRGVDRRFHLLGHMMVISIVVLAVLLYDSLNDWLTFLFPDATIPSIAYSGVILFLVTAVIVGHLSVANAMTPRKRWRAGFIVSGTMLAVILAGALVDEEDFSDVPSFPGQLKQMPVGLVPTQQLEEFLGDIKKAKDEADKAVKDTSNSN